ncbi:MAG: histidine phosphatase family protein [Eubacteriales bacterium]|nr:histidine phosphatase family protein [Eubacteriales bacterium]
MKLYLIRHADKEEGEFYNVFLKHQDPPITKRGQLRAETLTNYFENRNIDTIYVSEYLRARQTAAILASKKGLVSRMDRRLNEIDNGAIDGMSDSAIQEKYASFWNDYISHTKDVRFPEGETGEEARKRQLSLLSDLLAEGKDAVLICHERYIRLLICTVLDLPVYERYRFAADYCSITEIEFLEGLFKWRIVRINHSIETNPD